MVSQNFLELQDLMLKMLNVHSISGVWWQERWKGISEVIMAGTLIKCDDI